MFVTSLVILYHISPSRSKLVAEAILAEFDGIVGSDSCSAWNDVGSNRQKCRLHYFRDPYRTLDKNRTGEFKALFDEMHGTLRDAIGLAAEHPEGARPQREDTEAAGSDRCLDSGIIIRSPVVDCNAGISSRVIFRMRRCARHKLEYLDPGTFWA